MSKRVQEDRKYFRDVVAGRTRKKLGRLVESGKFVRARPKGGKLITYIKGIKQPFFAHGDNGEGVGRGPGKEGDQVGYDPDEGDGTGNEAGEGEGDGIAVAVDMEEVYKIMEELKLPNMKPKPSEVFEEVKKRYNDISKVGPESLRHTRRTMMEAIKRLAAIGELDKLHKVPGCSVPVKMITPINSDRRYRQYKEIRIPTSNAVIFFARDCSGSMSEHHCDVVSDMSWWIDCWIRRFYKRLDRVYFVHDARALEVNEEEFYTIRNMGGTKCSSAFEAVAEQIENRYPPSKFNIYLFYFTDGDNWGEDHASLMRIMEEKLGPEVVNMIGFTQVYSYGEDLKGIIDNNVKSGQLGNHIRTFEIGKGANAGWGVPPSITEEERDKQIVDGIRYLLTEEEE
jgi:uncharacterized sporulation protein YeaH/YhbH (DUF444 family)